MASSYRPYRPPFSRSDAAPYAGYDEPAAEPPPPPAEPETDRASLRQAVRDLEAAEARVQRNADRVYAESRARLVGELLPVLDNLDRTIDAATQHSDPALLEGVRMTRSQLLDVLVRFGVEPIDARGQLFDPALHEAISTVAVSDPARAQHVMHQYQAGYRFAGKLLRPARVTVGVLPVRAAVPRSFGA